MTEPENTPRNPGFIKQEVINNRMTFRQNFTEEYDFLMDLDEREDNEFLQSLYRQFMQAGTLSAKQRESILKAKSYQEAAKQREVLKTKHVNDEPVGAYVGELKKRYNMTLKLMGVRRTNRGFYVMNFVNREGSQLMCFNQDSYLVAKGDISPKSKIQEIGDCFTCRATVNRFSVQDFDPTNKFKQTVINRITVDKWLGNKNDE